MKKSREEFIEIYKKLNQLNESLNKKVLFVIFKNKELLKTVLDEVIEKEKSLLVHELQFFDKERIEINNKHGVVSETKEFTDLYKQDINELIEKYREPLNIYQNNKKTFDEFIKQEVELNIFKFSFSDIPDETTAETFELFKKFFKETDEEILTMV